jgi:hypothetical protein
MHFWNEFLYYANYFFSRLLAFLLLWNAYILAFNKGVPNIKTAPATQKKIVELLKKDFESRGGKAPYRIIDMGSGNGMLTRRIARALPAASVLGLEIERKAFTWATLMKKWKNIPNLEYRREDLFAHDVSHYDAVVFYLSSYEMERMGKKLHAELNPKALAISNRFRIGNGWAPAETVEAKTPFPFEREIHIYRKA